MRRTTDLMRTWKAEAKSGEGLNFELCKGGYFSDKDEYGLRLVGKTAQNTLEGTNLCLNFSDRTERDFGAFANTTQRELDGKSIYKGCTSNNYSIAGNIENYSLSGDTISFSTKATAYNVGIDIKIEPSTTYSLSALNSEFGWSVAEYTEDGTYIGCIVSGYLDSVVTFTTSETAYYVLIVLYAKTTNTVYSCTSPYLNKDSNKGYEPYCGGIPSPNPDYPIPIQCVKAGSKVKVCGKNLLKFYNKERLNAAGINFTESDKGLLHCVGTATTNSFFEILDPIEKWWSYVPCYFSGKTGMFSTNISGTLNGSYSVSLFGFNENKVQNFQATLRSYNNLHQLLIEIPIDVKYVMCRIGIIQNTVIDADISVQFEIGDTATEHEPYISGGELTVPCDLYEGDVYFPTSGKVERNTAIKEFDGTENWQPSTNSHSVPTYVLYNVVNDDIYYSVGFGERPFFKCTHAIAKFRNWWDHNKGGYIFWTVRQLYMTFEVDSFITVDDFKKWLYECKSADNPVKVIHKIEVPILEQYPPQPMLAPRGMVNVLQTPTELTGELSATMLTRRI